MWLQLNVDLEMPGELRLGYQIQGGQWDDFSQGLFVYIDGDVVVGPQKRVSSGGASPHSLGVSHSSP